MSNTGKKKVRESFLDVDFLHYPEIKDDKFYQKIYLKKEFNETKTISSDMENTTMEELCNPSMFTLKPYQAFIRNFISGSTNYNGLLAFWGVGVGKTCASLQIAEGLKHQILKLGKKIYIIGKKQVKEAFMNELYNFEKEKMEITTNSQAGSLQCTGKSYYISKAEEPDEEKRQGKIIQNIKQVYKFYGMKGFANYADKRIGSDNFKEVFSNSLFIIDEAHSLAGESKHKGGVKDQEEIYLEDEDIEFDVNEEEDEEDEEDEEGTISSVTFKKVKKEKNITQRGILTVLHDIIDKTVGTKFVLLTATPMKDNENELADILDILLHNDKRKDYPINREKLFLKHEKFINEEYLKKVAKGYISYVRGENPKIFPELIDVNSSKLPKGITVYKPNPMYDDAHNLIEDSDKIQHTDLIKCPMESYQYLEYSNIIKKHIQKTEKKQLELSNTIDMIGRQASIITFPTKSEKGQSFKDEILYGNEGFDSTFIANKTKAKEVEGKFKSHSIIQYSYLLEEGFLNIDKVGKYSKKLETYLKIVFNVSDPNPAPEKTGIIFTFSNFLKVGAILIALALEENGYNRYRPLGAGDNINLLRPVASRKIIKRCICGRLENDSIHSKEETISTHRFKQAYYCLFSADTERYLSKELKAINSSNNKYGEKIKIILGTSVASESLDFKRIREVHIFDPWHNNTRLYQVIGRAIRTCSHRDLNIDERNVTVYKYCSSAYEGKKLEGIKDNELKVETADEKVYRRIERKDLIVKKIERTLKVISVDCQFNKDLNLYGLKGKDGKRQCDYTICDYTCEGDLDKLDESDLNIDTYNLYFSEPHIINAQNIIHELFRENFVVDLYSLVNLVQKVDRHLTDKYIYEAINRIIKRKDKIKDRFGRTGIIIYANPNNFEKGQEGTNDSSYYIFQPDDITDRRSPLYYRVTPLTIKRNVVEISDEGIVKVKEDGSKNVGTGAILTVKDDKKYSEKKYNELLLKVLALDKYNIDYTIDREDEKNKGIIYEYAVSTRNDSSNVIVDSFSRYPEVYNGLVEKKGIYIHKFNDKWRIYSEGKWSDATDINTDIIYVKTQVKKEKTMRSNLIGFFDRSLDKNDNKFKYSDMTKENNVIKITEIKKGNMGEESLRNKLRGKVCGSYKVSEIRDFAKKIGINEVIANSAIKEVLCKEIELRLRELEDTDKNIQHFILK